MRARPPHRGRDKADDDKGGDSRAAVTVAAARVAWNLVIVCQINFCVVSIVVNVNHSPFTTYKRINVEVELGGIRLRTVSGGFIAKILLTPN